MKLEPDLPLARREEQPLVVRDPESILRFAMEKGASVEVIERMMAVRRELKAEQAKAAFDDAMRDFQAEMPVIHKGKSVPTKTGQIAYSYAPFEDILGVVRPLLRKYGFSYTLNTDTESKDGWVIAHCQVTHCAGHFATSTAKFPLGAGTQIMSATQVYAAALTFASRRVFCNAFGIVTGGEDQNGQGEKVKPAGPSSVAAPEPSLKEHAQALWNALVSVRGPEKNWKAANEWLWREEILDAAAEKAAPDLTAQEFKDALRKTTAKLAKP